MHKIIELGATEAIEVGPGKVLQGLFKKVDRAFAVSGAEL
jgi:[acyl-carrier-protein] S-malonyltransferase